MVVQKFAKFSILRWVTGTSAFGKTYYVGYVHEAYLKHDHTKQLLPIGRPIL
jgi:hypothetical protein